jgi:hypothetical protein
VRGLVTTLATVSAVACLTSLPSPADATSGTAGVCAGVTHCRVVAHDDVDGDFTNDTIALQRVSPTSLEVRVLTHTGTLLTHRVPLGPGRTSDRWGGSAAIDNAAGDELVVLTRAGARIRQYAVVRYHHGALHTEAAPDGQRRWQISGTGSPLWGWTQLFTDVGAVHMIRTRAVRHADGTYTAFRTLYGWHHGAWVLSHAGRTIREADRKVALHRAGFHISQLDQFPAS